MELALPVAWLTGLTRPERDPLLSIIKEPFMEATVSIYVIRIYRRSADDLDGFAGLVLEAGDDRTKPFHSMEELASIILKAKED